jgi:DNA-binding SARP family transcriptional activator/tetratricopeptide (TPR) repeat protein
MKQLSTLGGLALVIHEQPVLQSRRKDLALLAYLAGHGGRPVSRARLASLLWPSVDSVRSRQSLRRALVDLRQVLGDAIVLDEDQVKLIPGAVEVDTVLFEGDIAAERWKAAADRWGGDFLADLEDLGDEEWRSWLEGERTTLRSHLAWALERLVEECESTGHWKEAAAWAERWIAALPADERAAIRLVRALHADHRESEAAARHATLQRQLEDHTGARPSADFLRLRPTGPAAAPPQPGVRGFLNPEFVGRDKVMAALTSAWTEARRGTGRVVTLEGEEGLGKTRIGEEIARHVRSTEGKHLVLESRAFAAEADRPFFTLRLILAQLAAAPGLAAASPDVIAALAAASPAIRERFPGAAAARLPLDEAVVRGIAAVAEETPVLLLLDDAPVADRETQEVLAALIRRTPDRLLVLLTGEPGRWASSPLSSEERGLGHLTRQTLVPLSPAETHRLVASVVPMEDTVARALAESIHAHTSGLPGLVLLQLRQLADEGLLRLDQSGRWVPTVPVDSLASALPAGIREMMARRLHQLSDPVRRLLEAAAVLGPRIDPAVLERVSGLPQNTFRDALTELISRRLLRSSRSAASEFEFPGEAERRAVYQLVAPSARRRFHRAAASAFARGGNSATAEVTRHHRRLAGQRSWPRAIAFTSIVLAMVAAGIWWAWNARGGVVAPGALVLLATVEDLTGDSTLSAPLTEAARIGLQQSDRVHLYSRTQIRDALRRMRRADSSRPIDEDLAREIAVRDNVPAIIHLAIARVDSTYLLTGRLISPATGEDLSATKVTAANRGQILESMDDLLSRLRRTLGESRADISRRSRRLPLVTTASLPALESYTSGRVAWTVRRYAEARDHWTRAVALDSAFALALSSLGSYYFVIENDRRAGDRFFDRALAHVSRLTAREELALRSNIAGLRGPPEEAIRLAEDVARRYPERDTWYSLGTLLMQSRPDEARAALLQAIALDSNFTNGWINLATAERLRNQLPQALAAFEQARRLDSLVLYDPTLNLNQEWGATFLQEGDAAAAESVYRRMTAFPDLSRRAKGLRALAWLSAYRGRYREGERLVDEAAQLMERDQSLLSAYRNRVIQAKMLTALGQAAEARRNLHRAAVMPNAETVPVVFLFYAADAWLQIGEANEATRLLRVMEKRANRSPDDQGSLLLLRGMLLLQKELADSAIVVVRGAESHGLLGFRDVVLSEAFEQVGRLDSALAAAIRLSRMWQFGWEAQDRWVHAPIRVAVLSLAQGDTTAARAALDGLLLQWKGADPELPALRRARRLRDSLGR